MAACQSYLLCVPPGLLLLLIGAISFHLPKVQGRPTDFWCNSNVRKDMVERLVELKKEMAHCVGSDKLSSPIQLPCVWIRVAEWANKTLQQKHAEVVGALQGFRDGVHGVNTTTMHCQTSVLKRLRNNIGNYLAIVNMSSIQHDTVTPSHSAVQNCSSTSSLMRVLEMYRNLLQGKLEYFAIDLHDSICKVEHRTANS